MELRVLILFALVFIVYLVLRGEDDDSDNPE